MFKMSSKIDCFCKMSKKTFFSLITSGPRASLRDFNSCKSSCLIGQPLFHTMFKQQKTTTTVFDSKQ